MCLYATFQFSWWLRDHFSAPFGGLGGLYLPNAWWQTLQTSKRHTFRVSAFHRYHWFGAKLFLVGCAQKSKNAKKCCFGIWLRPRYKIPDFFTMAPVLTSTLTVCRRNRGDPSILYRTLKCVTSCKYYKKHRRLVCPGAAHAPIAVEVGPQFRTTIGVCKILSRSVEIWQYEGQKPVLSKNRARPSLCLGLAVN